MMAQRKLHPEDLYAAEQISRAVAFTAFIRLGPHDKRFADGMTSYPEALEAADLLNAESKFGRRALVYAHTPEGRAWPVSDDLARLAELKPFRSKWMDPDFRLKPKGDDFCRVCQRALKPGQARRMVLFNENTFEAVHRADWARARASDPTGVWNLEPIGPDCAARLGLEWSRSAEEVGQ